MPPNVDMLIRMKLSNQAATEVTSAQGQGILSLENFAKMDKDGVELVFCQLARPGGVEISADGQLNFGLVYLYVQHKY